MKKRTTLLLLLSLLLVILAGCSSNSETPTEDPVVDVPETDGFSYSKGLDENGMWENVEALDYVQLSDYNSLVVPKSEHEISEDMIQAEIDAIIESYITYNEVMDRAVVDGDTLNIDYVGSVDGVEFQGGSTGGNGTEVTIGVTQYIDDFLEQLIGHMPGETFDIEVTFPENYGNEELNGQDAVFNITINSILEEVRPEFTDAFVAENLAEEFGFSTVDEIKTNLSNQMQEMAVSYYVQDFLFNNSTVETVPESMIAYQEESFLAYYEEYAASYGMELEEFISTYLQTPSIEDLLTAYEEENTQNAKFFLIIQAVAEQEDIQVDESEIATYFMDNLQIEDYSEFETMYGKPYLVLNVLHQKVLDFVTEKAVLE